MPTKPLSDGDLLTQKFEQLAAARQEKVASLAARQASPDPINMPVQQPDLWRSLGDVGIKTAQGVVDLGQSVVGLGSLASFGAIGKGARALGYDPEATNQFLGQYLSRAQQEADQKVSQAQGFTDTVSAALENPRAILGSVVESLPGMVAGMGVTGAAARTIGLRAVAAAGEDLATAAGQRVFQEAVKQAETKLLAIGAGTEGAQSAGQIADQAQAAGRSYDDYALPAIAAGVGTAAIGLAAGRLMGDAATDMAAGTHTLTGSLPRKVLKEAFSEGVLEEMPQSAQEQAWTNVAMGKPVGEGVENAAASGLLAGAAMGAGFGGLHGSHGEAPAQGASQAQDPTQAVNPNPQPREQAQFVAAAQANAPEPFMDPQSPDYSPTKAIGVMLQHNRSEDATPETRMANFNKTLELMDQLDARTDDLRQVLKTGSRNEIKAAKVELAQLDKETRVGQEMWRRMTEEMEKSRLPGNLQDEIQKINTPVEADTPEAEARSTEAQDAADRVITLSMASITQLSPKQAEDLAENTDNSLTDTQRDFLRKFSVARQAFNAAQDAGSVTKQVLNGGEGNLGLTQYRFRIGAALAAGDAERATKYFQLLDNFTQDHQAKVEAINTAFEQYGAAGQVVRTDTGWSPAPPETFKNEAERQQNGGLDKIPPKFTQKLALEAQALTATRDEMAAAMALKFGEGVGGPQTGTGTSVDTVQGSAVQSGLPSAAVPDVPAAAPQSDAAPLGSPASLFREKREREGRVEKGEPFSTPEEVESPPLSVVSSQQNSLASQQATPVAPNVNSVNSSRASPASQPSAPIAVAPGVAPAQGTAASLASAQAPGLEDRNPKNTNPQPAATERPAGAAAQAPAAEVATAAGENTSKTTDAKATKDSSKQEAPVVPSGNNSSEETEADTGKDIPRSYFNTKVDHADVWVSDEGKFESLSPVPAHKALASIKETLSNLEALISCMKG